MAAYGVSGRDELGRQNSEAAHATTQPSRRYAWGIMAVTLMATSWRLPSRRWAWGRPAHPPPPESSARPRPEVGGCIGQSGRNISEARRGGRKTYRLRE